MNLENLKVVGYLFLISVLCFAIHTGALYVLDIDVASFYHSPLKVYLIYYIVSVILYVALFFVGTVSFTYIGLAFLSAITLEFLLSYLLLRPILKNPTQGAFEEKVSFISSFFMFLIFQTILTARLLNEKR